MDNRRMSEGSSSRKPNILILYGSQTGTAEELGERLGREAVTRGFIPMVNDMNVFSPQYLQNKWIPEEDPKFVIFIASTTGQGESPGNMDKFWKQLCKASLKKGFLRGMKFAVIGLGDSSYTKYNFVGKKLYRRLEQLGAKPFQELCLGDDQHDHGYHAAVNPWINQFWQNMETQALSDGTLNIVENNGMPFSKFIIGNSQGDNLKNSINCGYKGMTMELLKVVENKRVTSLDHWQDTRLISIHSAYSSLKYEPGDVLMIQPSNLTENVEKFFEIFPQLKDAEPFYLYPNPLMIWVKIAPEIRKLLGPMRWTWEQVANFMLDIQSVPRIYFFELMSHFATNELEKERLSEFCTPQGQEDLYNYCNRPKRNILEVFEDFPNATKKIPPQFLFDLIPAIKPRAFSIASSFKQSPHTVQILMAVVEYKTKIKAKRKGLCSNWIAHQCPEGTSIPVWISKGSFKFPSFEEDANVILIGPGTGISAFRSVIRECLFSPWNIFLFFGCRNEAKDYYFKDEWFELSNESWINLYPAFSRDSNGQKREYVQDKILQESNKLIELFKSPKKFYIYIAGNAKQMPNDVAEALSKVMDESNPGISGGNLIANLKKVGRYQTETWA